MRKLFLENLEEHRTVMAALADRADDVARTGERLARAIGAGGKLLFCGNGGSAAAAQHLAADLTGRFVRDRRPLPGVALSTDSSALSSIANDYGFEQVFARQIQALGRPGDLLVCISTSGRSANLLRAAEAARACEVQILGLLGSEGGPLQALCDDWVRVPSSHVARIQEAHLLIAHCWCQQIESHLGCGR